jgi:hypothetical protein
MPPKISPKAKNRTGGKIIYWRAEFKNKNPVMIRGKLIVIISFVVLFVKI